MEEMKSKIDEVERERAVLFEGGGADAIQKQHQSGKLTARERILLLLDEGSFNELDLWMKPRLTGSDVDKKFLPGDGVVTGFGEIHGRPVYVYAQDFTVLGGSVASVHARKIMKVMEEALRMRVPCIGMIDSGGGRIQDTLTGDMMDNYPRIFYLHTILSGVVPQISLIMGPSAAGAAYSPILTDFCFMVKDTSSMYIASPELIKSVSSRDCTVEEIGSPQMHAQVSGCSDLTVADDKECILNAKELLSYLPQNNRESPPFVESQDDPDRLNHELLEIVPADLKKPYDVREVIKCIADNRYFFEIKKDFAPNIVIGFLRLGGRSIGVIANNPRFLAGAIDIDASDKHARFVRFCDAFNIPLLFLVDTPAYLPGVNQERGGIIRHGAKILHAVSEATVPKVTVVLRKAYGGGITAMCPRAMGANLVLAWPCAEIALMGAEGAVSIIFRKELKEAKDSKEVFARRLNEYKETIGRNPYHAAEIGWVEDIIDPRFTRSILVKAFSRFAGKTEERPWKKHGNIPL